MEISVLIKNVGNSLGFNIPLVILDEKGMNKKIGDWLYFKIVSVQKITTNEKLETNKELYKLDVLQNRKITQNRVMTIPKDLCESLKISENDVLLIDFIK